MNIEKALLRKKNIRAVGEYGIGFLDDALLNFTMKLPAVWRLKKPMYWVTIGEMLPDLFAATRATRGAWTWKVT